jgi:hypothetical protein
MSAFANIDHAGGLKLAARRMVLATSCPPLAGLWRGFYSALAAQAVRLFKQYPGIQTVYLRRGFAKGEIVPGISDIDFALIGELSDPELADLTDRYHRLARRSSLLDQSLEIYTSASLLTLYNERYDLQYRFMEGKSTWRLIYGHDFLQELPDLPSDKLVGGLFYEIKVWWALFAGKLLRNNRLSNDVVTRNSTCYKAVAEVLKIQTALDGGPLTFSRVQALEYSKNGLHDEDRQLVEQLQQVARRRFLGDDPSLVDQTLRFLLRRLDDLHGRFATHPILAPIEGIRQCVEFDPAEHFPAGPERGHSHTILEHVKQWPAYRSAHQLSSAFFNLDDTVLFISIDPAQLPSMAQLKSLIALHSAGQKSLSRRLPLFLLLDHAAFQIDPDDLQKSWQTILIPGGNPDLFELLQHPQCVIDGSPRLGLRGASWNELIQHFFVQEKSLFYGLLDDPAIYKLNLPDFFRTFWKTAQLVLMNRAVARGTALYPLTLPAIQRHLAAEGMPLPPALNALSQMPPLQSNQVAALIPNALAYLKEIK